MSANDDLRTKEVEIVELVEIWRCCAKCNIRVEFFFFAE
jgi:hypothetical protein